MYVCLIKCCHQRKLLFAYSIHNVFLKIHFRISSSAKQTKNTMHLTWLDSPGIRSSYRKKQSVNHTLDDMDYTRVQIRIWVWSDLLEFLHEMLPALCQLNASLIVPVCSLCKYVFSSCGVLMGVLSHCRRVALKTITLCCLTCLSSPWRTADPKSEEWHINHTETH